MTTQGYQKIFGKVELYIDYGVGYTTVCICLNSLDLGTKRANVTILKLYLKQNKLSKEIKIKHHQD